MKHVLIEGNPIDGFSFTGPFDSHDEAVDYAEANSNNDSWNIADLIEPGNEGDVGQEEQNEVFESEPVEPIFNMTDLVVVAGRFGHKVILADGSWSSEELQPAFVANQFCEKLWKTRRTLSFAKSLDTQQIVAFSKAWFVPKDFHYDPDIGIVHTTTGFVAVKGASPNRADNFMQDLENGRIARDILREVFDAIWKEKISR